MESELQCELLNTLIDVKWSQCAVKFYGLLLKASKDIQDLEKNSNGMSNQVSYEEADMVLKELQDITDSTGDSFVNYLAETFFRRFCFDDSAEVSSEEAKAKEVLASLLKIDEHERAKYADAKEYLQHMICNMESLVNTEDLKQWNIFNVYDPLEKFIVRLKKYRNFRAEKILNIIFEIGRSRLEFTEEQQKKIGVLMIEALDAIKSCIKCCFNVGIHSLLKKRSALQFLYEDYGEFPAGSATLHQEFEKVNLMETVEILNSKIDRWCHVQSLHRDVRSDFERSGASNLPDCHREWWSNDNPPPKQIN